MATQFNNNLYNTNMYDNNLNNNMPQNINFTETEGQGALEISNAQKQRKCSAVPRTPLGYLLAALITICGVLLFTYIFGCIDARVASYGNRNKVKVFRTECEGIGGRIVDHNHRLPGWGAAYVNCVHDRPQGQDLRADLMTRTRSFDMRTGEVTELRW